MGLEIERKFLVILEHWPTNMVEQSVWLRQAYLSDAPEKTIRVRTAGDKGYLTIKGMPKGITRQEWEWEIPVAEAHELIDGFATAVIEKIRHYLHYAGKLWEVDEFKGRNEGLWVAEIELAAESESFERPSWTGLEVTDDIRYLNSRLSKHPFQDWK